MSPRRTASSTRFALSTTVLFAVLVGLCLAGHEMWRDELQAWLIARDTPTLASFFQAMRYEGTPPLWHLLLRGLSFFFQAPAAMQVVHGLLATGLVFIFCRYAPFPRWFVVQLCFSYYVFYQYAVISRNYLPGLLLLSLACVGFKEGAARPWRVGLPLMLAAWTSAPALLVAGGLAAAATAKTRRPQILLIYLLGAISAIAIMAPARDALFPSSPGWVLHFHTGRLLQVLDVVVKAFFPSPLPTLHFWENAWITHLVGYAMIGPVAAIGLLIWAGRSSAATRESLIVFGVGSLSLLAFYYAKYLGFSRHHGFLFFNLIFALWIAGGAERRTLRVLGLLLGLQLIGTGVAASYDARYPFSCGREAARYLQSSPLNRAMVAAGPDYIGGPVAVYAGTPFYSAQGDRWQSFTRWDLRRIELFDDREFIRRARIAARTGGHHSIVMMINYPLDPKIGTEAHAEFLKSFIGSIVGDEDYYLYRIPG